MLSRSPVIPKERGSAKVINAWGLNPCVYQRGIFAICTALAIQRFRSKWEINRAAPVFLNQILTVFNADSSFETGRPAGGTGFGAVRACLIGICLFAFSDQEFLCNAIIQMIPRENLIKTPLPVGIKSRIYITALKSLHPFCI